MILKKPYAFLIKHFKLIHLILSILFLYLLFQTGNINQFFNNYVSAGYTTNELNIASNYIHSLVYIVIIIVLLINIAILFLMKQKEKSTKLYLGIIIFYIVMLISTIITNNTLNIIEEGTFSSQAARAFRDITFVFYIPQIFFFVYALLRGIGFDIKKFDFETDVKELEITDLDREEFELTFGKNNYKYQRGWRRFRREFKYYFLENKFAFFFLLIGLMAGVAGILYLNFGVYHKSYGEQQRMNHNGLMIKVVDSILTNMYPNGQVISKDKYYLAVSLDITNTNSESVRLDYENFKILVNNEYVMPTLDRGTIFPDLGIAYTRDMTIESGKSGVYVIVYEISNPNPHYDLRILESLENTLIGVTPIYKTIRLNYDKIIEKKDIKKYELGKILDLSDTRLNVTELQIKDYSFTNSYNYEYNKCTSNDVCQKVSKTINIDPTKYGSNKKILVLNVYFQLDKSCYYYQTKKNVNSFINDFVTIKAKKNNKVKTYSVDSLTPSELNDVWLLAIDSPAESSDKLDLILSLHGNNYIMNIK